MNLLPSEVMEIIIGHLDQKKDRLSFLLTCRAFRELKYYFDQTVDDNKALLSAVHRKDLAEVRWLLSWRGPLGKKINPFFPNNLPFLSACRTQRIDLLRAFLENSSVADGLVNNDSVVTVIDYSWVDGLQLLLDQPGSDFIGKKHHVDILCYASTRCNGAIMQMLLSDDRMDPRISDYLPFQRYLSRATPPLVVVVRAFFQHPRLNTAEFKRVALIIACNYELDDTVLQFLLNEGGCDVSEDNYSLLRCPHVCNHTKETMIEHIGLTIPENIAKEIALDYNSDGLFNLVFKMIQCCGLNASFNDNSFFRCACSRGDLITVQRLMVYPEIFGTAPAIFQAMALNLLKHNVDLFQYLASVPGFLDLGTFSDCLKHTILLKHWRLFRFLLQHALYCGRSVSDSGVLSIAARADYRYFSLLLSDPHIDASARRNESLYIACESNAEDNVWLLLERPEVNPSDGDNRALEVACIRRHSGIVRLLLSDKRVNLRHDGYRLLSCACLCGNDAIVAALLKHPHINPKLHEENLLAFSTRIREMLQACIIKRERCERNRLKRQGTKKRKVESDP